MANAFWVFLAGGLGCLSRYFVGLCILPIMGFPIGTLIVNVVGGFLAGIVASKYPQFRIIFLTGFLGGFTTFSAFSLECLVFMQNQQVLTGIAYICVSVFLSILAAWLGFVIFK